jgi:hypothetical protein
MAGTALTNNNVAGNYMLPAKHFNAQPFAV